MGARHRPVDPALVEEDEVFGRDRGDFGLEALAQDLDALGVAFVVAEGLFCA